MFTRVHHVSYQIEDVKPMRDFLEKNFGMTPAEEGQSQTQTKFDYIAYRIGDMIMDFISPVGDSGLARRLKETGPVLHHVAWATDGVGIEDLFNQLKAKGTTIKNDAIVKSPKGYIRFDIDEADTCGIPLQLAEGDPLGWDDNQEASEKVQLS